MTVVQLLDLTVIMNVAVVAPCMELLKGLSDVSTLHHPINRILELMRASPTIEPEGDAMQLEIGSSTELRSLLEDCETLVEGNFSERRVVTSCALEGSTVPAGIQVVSISAGGSKIAVHDKSSICSANLPYPVQVCFSEKIRPARFHGKIEFEDVHFAYPSQPQKPVLNGVSFTVEPGQKVALVGATGGGKSTIMSLLLRLYRPQMGTIKLDGRPIEDYDLHFLRSRIAIVDQHTVLFRGTLRENITYGMDRPVSDAEVERACREACAWDFIEERPEKLMTEVAAGASNFSGGQRQRIAIARAMVRQPDMILLDEATSALDARNEALVQEGLDRLAQKGSALVIAHRLSTVRDSDQIVVFDRGVVQEQGTHEQLLCQPPLAQQSQVQCHSLLPSLLPPQPGCGRDCFSKEAEDAPKRVTYEILWEAASKTKREQASPRRMTASIAQLKEQIVSDEVVVDGVVVASREKDDTQGCQHVPC